jgi:hypothetical protein
MSFCRTVIPPYVFLTLKCVFLAIMFITRRCSRSCFLSLFERQIWEKCTQLVERECNKYCTSCNWVFPTWLPSTLHLLFIFFDTGFEVVRIHIAVWISAPCSLVHGYGYFGGSVWVCLHRQSEVGGSMPWPIAQYPLIRLHSPITWKTVSLNLNILRFPCIVSLLQNKGLCLLAINVLYYFTLCFVVSTNMSEKM